MNYKRKNKDSIVLLLLSFLIFFTLGVYLFQRNFYPRNMDLKAIVYPLALQIGDTLHFSEKTPINLEKRWEFGDGNFSFEEQGFHCYTKPGFYQVSCSVHGWYTQTVSVEVKSNTKVDYGDYYTSIDAPSEAMQYENVIFRAVTDRASLFSWKFGETGNIDAKEPFVIYSYQEPGEYEVYLYTDETAYPVVHKITIHLSFKNVNEQLNVEDKYKIIDNDFKEHLQQIARGLNFNEHYNYLVNKYLCEDEVVVVSVNVDKRNSFYFYCMGLRFDKKVELESVKVGFDEQQNCVTKITIIQGTN